MNRLTRLTAVAAAAVLAASLAVAGTMTAHAATGPWSIVSAASNSLGIDEATGTFTVDGTFTPITIASTTGYGELTTPDSKCLTLSGSSITAKLCTGAAAQLWQSATHTGFLLWWNKSAPGSCKFGTGTTQQVITTPAGGGNLTVACPPTTGPAWPYTTSQEWSQQPPVTPSPTPTPTPTPTPSSPPPSQCAQPTAPATSQPDIAGPVTIGGVEASYTGAQIAQWDPTQFGLDGNPTHGTVGTDTAGDAVLTTTGATTNEAMVASCSSIDGTGTIYTHGVFEAVMQMPVTNGKVTNWPAFWISNPVQANWPVGGEFDIMEAGTNFSGGLQQADYHWNIGGGQVNTQPGPGVTMPTGWVTFDGVWGPGYVAVYMNGQLQFTYKSGNVESDAPLEVIFDIAGLGVTCTAANEAPCQLLIRSLTIWATS